MSFPRICGEKFKNNRVLNSGCGKRFMPAGKYQGLCYECLKKSRSISHKKKMGRKLELSNFIRRYRYNQKELTDEPLNAKLDYNNVINDPNFFHSQGCHQKVKHPSLRGERGPDKENLAT